MLFVTHRQEIVSIQQAHLLVEGMTTEPDYPSFA